MGEALLYRLVTLNAYLSYFLIGFVSVIFAPALPAMINDFGLSLVEAGGIFPAKSLGAIAAVMVGGAWSDRIGRKPTIAGGAILLAVGSLGVAWGRTWPLVLTAFLLSGVGQGFVNSSINALVADLNRRRPGKALNMLHGVYGMGAFAGPFVAGALAMANQGWRPAFLLCGLLWAVSTVFTLLLPFPKADATAADRASSDRAGAPAASGHQGRPLWGGWLFIGLWLVAFLYNSTALGLIGWINTYLADRTDLAASMLAANMVAVFYVALTTGRFMWSRMVDGIGYDRAILLCAIGPVLAYPLVIWSAHIWIIAAGVMVCGLFFAGLYPTALAYATRRQPELTGSISGAMAMAMSLGTMVVPWLTGIIAARAGFQTGMAFIYILVIALLAVAVGVCMLGKHQPSGRLPDQHRLQTP